MDKLLPFFIKLVEIFRSKFENRVTWVIVIAGISLMTSPVWISAINALLATNFGISITQDSDVVWGFALCCAGLIYHLLNNGLHEVAAALRYREDNSGIYDHDCAIFEELNRIMDEDTLDYIMDGISTDDAIYWDNFKVIGYFSQKASSANTSFISPVIKEQTEELTATLNEFRKFVNAKFDEYPYRQQVMNFKMCLAPNLNSDRAGEWEDGPKYAALASEMMLLRQSCLDQYKIWRLAIKDVLYI